eukprot:TRINITY_DN16074_c0_g1_i1.p1 TRINITY_DN16074_c0_g1~~TRINITY_DN16074_c0_g1_i1.p1  ORF type:complete len:104 (-),score=13.30 TRINITY_DN16074_c0_g1_i1:181-492(-)
MTGSGHVDTELAQQIFNGLKGLTSLILSTPCTHDLSWIKHKRLVRLELSLLHNMQQKRPIKELCISDVELPNLNQLKLKVSGRIERVTLSKLPFLLNICRPWR